MSFDIKFTRQGFENANQTPLSISGGKNVHKIGDAHRQCVNNHYANFEYKVMKTVEVTLVGTPKVL